MNENDSTKLITNLYEKILKRQPDKTGLYFFVTQLKSRKLTIKDIEDILFETNSSKIDTSSELVLEAFASWLNANEAINIEIQGHTDDIGAEEDNLALSKDRAFSVMEFLIKLDVSPSRLKFKGYGELQPKYDNDNKENRSKNRRTDFLIL